MENVFNDIKPLFCWITNSPIVERFFLFLQLELQNAMKQRVVYAGLFCEQVGYDAMTFPCVDK
jgi:hypothetical protein